MEHFSGSENPQGAVKIFSAVPCIKGVVSMKKILIAALSLLVICLCLAACKSNSAQQPEGSDNSRNSSADASQASGKNDSSRTDEAPNGVVTDDNGIIGDGDNKDNALSDVVDDAVSGAQSIADNAGEGLQSAGEDLKNGAENAAEGIRDGAENAASNIREGVSDLVSDDDESSEE